MPKQSGSEMVGYDSARLGSLLSADRGPFQDVNIGAHLTI